MMQILEHFTWALSAFLRGSLRDAMASEQFTEHNSERDTVLMKASKSLLTVGCLALVSREADTRSQRDAQYS